MKNARRVGLFTLSARSPLRQAQGLASGWAYNGFTGMHLRHNRKGNAWFTDGHVASLGASEVWNMRAPGSGTVSNNRIEFTY